MHQIGVADWKKDLRQGNHELGASLTGHNSIRQQFRVCGTAVIVVFHRGHVLAVFNDHTRLVATGLVVDHLEIVPFILTTPQIKKRTGNTTQASTDALRTADRELLGCGVVSTAGEIMRSGCVREHLIHCSCRRNGFGRPLQRSHIGKVIGQMLSVNCDHTINGRSHTINAEHLILCGIVGLGFDEALVSQFREQPPGGGILENTLKRTIPFFRYLTRQAFSQHTDTIGIKTGRIRTKENRNHSVCHLGSISIFVMPPVKLIAFSPGYSTGKPEPSTRSFLGIVPL